VYAYNFMENRIPGLKAYEKAGYWLDVGTIQSYWQAHMELVSARPRFDLANTEWPIHSGRHEGPPLRVTGSTITDALFSGGCVVERAVITRSVLGRDVIVQPGAVIEESVIMDGCVVGAGARLTRTIVDRFNTIPPGAAVGGGAGRYPGAFVDESGSTVIPRGGR